jgi:hypothetical protein
MLIEFAKLFDYQEASDRAIAIVGPAYLNTLLSEILTEFMIDNSKEVRKLLHPEGPLGTYGSRTTACYFLGLVRNTVIADLRYVRKIRNRFAHDIRASFTDPKISQWCQQLAWHKESIGPPPEGATTRDLFQVGVNQLVAHLRGLPGLARLSKRRPFV